MLVKPTVSELLSKGENRYRLVVATAKRARQIYSGKDPMVVTEDSSPVTIAADEIEKDTLKIYDKKEWNENIN